jgi:hypothetical protein
VTFELLPGTELRNRSHHTDALSWNSLIKDFERETVKLTSSNNFWLGNGRAINHNFRKGLRSWGAEVCSVHWRRLLN